MIQRRLYIYIVAAASLGMLVTGLTNLGTTTLDLLLRPGGITSTYRDAYAIFGALTLVGLPVWAIHWTIAQRLSAGHADERTAALRRLYLYLVTGVLLVAAAIFARRLLEHLLGAALGSGLSDSAVVLDSAWEAVLLLAFWAYHFQVATTDRSVAGERGASATLRRWYAYALLAFGLAFLLFGARNLLEHTWVTLLELGQTLGAASIIASALATTLTGLAIWGFHFIWTSRGSVGVDDRHSTLRAVQGFVALAIGVALALLGASQMLYYALARALGIPQPGGVGGDLVVALAGPASTAVVFAFAWIWLRHGLAEDAGEAEALRQAGVRRMYTHLVALLALAALAVGTAGLLWTLSDQLLNHLLDRPVVEWRDLASLFITLTVVGMPMWLTHWGATPVGAERHTLSRRLYLYASLLGSVLALLVSAATLVYRLLGLILATTGASSGAAVVDIGRATSVIFVAVALGAYHWRVLRQDAALRPASEALAAAAGFTVEVSGATEEDIRGALARLPQGATYFLIQRPLSSPQERIRAPRAQMW